MRALTGALVSRTRPLEAAVDLLDALGPGGFAWITDGAGFVTAGVAARLVVGPGPDRIERAAAEVAGLLAAIPSDDEVRGRGTGPIAVGALPFDDRVAGELVIPAVVVGGDWITEIRDPAVSLGGMSRQTRHSVRGSNTFELKEHPSREEWTAGVRRVLAGIDAGELRKVVLARELVVEAPRPFDRLEVLDRLRRSHPSCFTYACGNFVGASPELIVSRRGDEVVSRPMAGTVARGATQVEDDRLVTDMRRSAKETEEHRLLVDDVVALLAPVCAEAPSAAPSEVVRLATVSHLATRVSGRLRSPAPSALALAGRLHPTPAVGGLPRRPALRAIAELEGFDRGLYAGPVGWVDAAGDGEWAVALRSAELEGARARLVAGAGIVAGSDPDAEWAETEAKLATMLSALG